MSAAPAKMRLDQLLVTKELVETRQRAQALIMAGQVTVDDQVVTKSATFVDISLPIVVKKNIFPYVSRGGQKLEKALDHFRINIQNKVCLDIGASTGGFTDCLLQRGARKVYAIDVGRGQLDQKLRQDPRVINVEKTNIRYLEKTSLPDLPDLATIDVSFISLDKVLPKAYELIKIKGEIIALIKPQFEAGPKRVSKGGVVRDAKVHTEVVQRIELFSQILAMEVKGVIESPLKGPAGNIEFLIYMVKS